MGAEERGDFVTNSENKNESPEDLRHEEDLPLQKETLTIREKWKEPDYRRKVWRTLWLGASLWVLGFAIGQKGPAFLDLQIITQTNVEAASFFFTASSCGYLSGSLVTGVIYDRMNKTLLLLLSVLGLGTATITLPWCSVYVLMIGIQFIGSLFCGGLDTAGNAELVRVWGKDGEAAMQFIHFSFAFGGVIGPLVTEPFLTPNPEENSQVATTTIRPHPDNLTLDGGAGYSVVTPESSNVTANSTAIPAAPPLTTNVHYAFLIAGCIILLVAIPLTVELFTDRKSQKRQDRSDEKKAVKQPLPTGFFVFVMFMFCLLYMLYCAVEDSFASFLTTFVVKQLHWTKSRGAQITSIFWLAFTVGRFLCIFAVRLLSSVKLLVCSTLAIVLSLVAFTLLSYQNLTLGVWISTVTVGVSLAAVFATGFTWMEEEFLRVTGGVASAILIASSTGSIINPILLGYLMQEITPMWLSYLLFIESVLVFCVFIFLLALSRLYIQKHYSVRLGTMELEVIAPTLEQDSSGNVAEDNNKL